MEWVEKSLRGDLLLFFTGRYHCSRYDVWFGDCGTDKKMRGQDAKIFTPSDQNEQDMSTTEGQLDGFGDGVREAEGWCIYWKMELPGRMKRLRPQRRFMDGVQKVVATKDATDWGTRRTWRKISIFWKKKKNLMPSWGWKFAVSQRPKWKHNLQRNGLNEIELGNRTEYNKTKLIYKQSSRQGALCCRDSHIM